MTTGRRSREIPSAPVPAEEWVEIKSTEYYWRLAEMRKQERKAKQSRIDLVAALAEQGPDAVHQYCVENYGHGSRFYMSELIGSV